MPSARLVIPFLLRSVLLCFLLAACSFPLYHLPVLSM